MVNDLLEMLFGLEYLVYIGNWGKTDDMVDKCDSIICVDCSSYLKKNLIAWIVVKFWAKEAGKGCMV